MLRVSFLLSLGVCTAVSVTPVEKVITLLEDLKTQVESEGAAEATTYDEFACFCKETTATKSGSITTGQDDIDLASATIEEKTAKQTATMTELAERKVKQEQLKADLESTTVRCAKEKAAYEVKDADLVKAIGGLNGALKALGDAKPSAFLSFRKSDAFKSSMAFAKMLPKRAGVTKLLQQLNKVDPSDPTYEYHSQGILDTITQLLKEFQDEKAAADDEETKRKGACDATKATLNEEIGTNADGISSCETTIGLLTVEIAETREGLVNSEAMMKDDQAYLKDLTARCESRAKDWDQRSSLRSDELKALSEALTILSDKVSIQDTAVNERAFLQHATVRPHAVAKRVLLEVESKDVVKAGRGSSSAEMRVGRVMDLLVGESRRLHSQVLSAMAAHAAADPFAKVKTLIQGLVERLLKEATAEATKKGFCDTELGKAKQDRDYRWEDVSKLTATLGSLRAKEDELEQEIDSLTIAVTGLYQAVNTSTEIRASEKADNLKTISDANEGLVAVKEAIGILKTFYKSAAKADKYHSGELNKVSLAQASPVDEDTSGPGFNAPYKGNQQQSAGIIGLLEVIQSDFERTLTTTASDEKKAAADFVEFDRVSKTDISGKETKITLDQEDLAQTKNKIEQASADLSTNQELLDSALKAIEELAPMCIDMTMPYEERVAKREEEIAALNKALCILDTDGVEADCSGGGESMGGMPTKR